MSLRLAISISRSHFCNSNTLQVPDHYHYLEQQYRHLTALYSIQAGYPTMLENPDEGGGYTTIYDGKLGLKRLPSVEMANIRQCRGKNNKRCKRAVKLARTGIDGLDPIDPNPNSVPPPFMPEIRRTHPEPLPPQDPDPLGINQPPLPGEPEIRSTSNICQTIGIPSTVMTLRLMPLMMEENGTMMVLFQSEMGTSI